MKTVVVIDTQLFLRAAVRTTSLPYKLIFELSSLYELVVSPETIAEVKDVLTRAELRAKFRTLTEETTDTIVSILNKARLIELTNIPAISRDPKDDVFLACAVEGKAQYLVSEDKDLLVLNPYQGVSIVNALEFLRILNVLSS